MFIHTILTLANAQGFNPFGGSVMTCDSVWGMQSIPFASQPPSISVQIQPFSNTGSLALSIFRFEDRMQFTVNPYTHSFSVCGDIEVSVGLCLAADKYRFIVRNESIHPILNQAITWHDFKVDIRDSDSIINSSNSVKKESGIDGLIEYDVAADGLYCIIAVANDSPGYEEFETLIKVVNPYGKLPAIFFPALPFFAAALTAYTIIGVVWMIMSYHNRHELLPIQNLIGMMIAFLIIENAFNLLFFNNYNLYGQVSPSMLGVMVTLNAGRNSLSFFMLLIVSLGYGVVRPSLGKKMYASIALAVIHFGFGALYFTMSMLTSDANSSTIFFLGIPLTITLSIFYVSIFFGINDSIQYLESKRQTVKLQMYQRLSAILVTSMIILILIFLVNSINISFRHYPSWVANQWKWRWLLLDGRYSIISSLNANYFLTMIAIAFLWMPDTNNRRLGLEQLGSEDEDENDMAIEMDLSHEQILEWAEHNVEKVDNVLPTSFVTDDLLNRDDVETLN